MSEGARADRSDGESTGLVVPWGGLSLALAIVSLASLGTLAVIVSVQDIDSLSTIALALAVISFAAQLIVSLAQSQHASQVNSDTRAALADMRSTTSSLLINQREQFDKVLDAALTQAIPAAVEDVQQQELDAESPEAGLTDEQINELEQRLAIRLRQALSTPSNPPEPTTRPQPDEELARLLSEFPPEAEAREAVEVIRDLAPAALYALGRAVAQLKRTARPDRTVRFTRRENRGRPTSNQRLIDAGLLEEISAPPLGTRGRAIYRFTPLGLTLARVLEGTEGRPDWIAEALFSDKHVTR